MARKVLTPVWGPLVWAHRRDRLPDNAVEEGALVQVQRTIWTMRRRSDVVADVEIVHGGAVWHAVGPPIIRGGAGTVRGSLIWKFQRSCAHEPDRPARPTRPRRRSPS